MPSEKKLEMLIQLLIRQTTEGLVKWKSSTAPKSRLKGSDDVIEEFFETAFKGQGIAVFERRFKDYDPDTDSRYWASAYCFAFVAGGELTWETEEAPLLPTIFKVAKESAADIDGILNSLLS